ncbi:MAG: hypothetical protein WAK11_08565 [Candidatus Cybelea sp.]
MHERFEERRDGLFWYNLYNVRFFGHYRYLVLVSYALFNEGSSGLTITIGAIVTLFAIMQLTGRSRWSEHLAEVAA